jgi:hypothetical protein
MVTNFFPITIPFEQFEVSRLPFTEARLHELRAAHNQTHSFFRNGDYIYVSPMKEASLAIGEVVKVKVAENLDIVGSLIRHMLFRAFKDTQPNIVPLSFAPLSFLSINKEFDLARHFLPEALQGVVMFPRLIEISVRLTKPLGIPQFGLVITVRHRWVFRKTVQELIDEGYNVVGRAVMDAVPLPGLENVLAPKEDLLGTIASISGQMVKIATNEGTQERSAKLLFLTRSRHEIGDYLSARLGRNEANRIFKLIRDEEPERVSPSFMLGNAQKMAKWLSERIYQNLDAFCFSVSRQDSLPGDSFQLEPTKFIFGLTPGSSADSILSGLWRLGPYDRSRFDKKSPRVLAIFHKSNRGYATNFLGKLVNGIPDSQFFKKGFKDLFRLHDVQVQTEELDSYDPPAYEEAISRAVRGGHGGFDLAIVETLEESKRVPPAQNSYLRAKAKLMMSGIPVQCVLGDRLKGNDGVLASILGPIALQLYAKLGGIPWVLPANQSVDREIIIGIGNSIQRKNLYSGAEQSRIVGLTTFFSGEGRYLLGQQLRSVPYNEYFYELLEGLKRSISHLADEYGWKPGDNVRLVFHVFKPVRNVEVEVVDQLVKGYPDFRIKHAFVTVSRDHPFMMFRAATPDRGDLNILLCERGENIVLDERSCLLQIRGPKHVRTTRHKFPTPVLIRMHENSSYHDLQYIAQQILDFSWASWRSFTPASTPVSIFYSELIAKMTRELQQVPGWSPDILNSHFRSTKWFL